MSLNDKNLDAHPNTVQTVQYHVVQIIGKYAVWGFNIILPVSMRNNLNVLKQEEKHHYKEGPCDRMIQTLPNRINETIAYLYIKLI